MLSELGGDGMRRRLLSELGTEEDGMEQYKLIHDTGEIANETSSISIPLSKPLKKMYALWKIVGNENTTTANMYCFVNNNNTRWYTNGSTFQKSTTSGGVAILEEIAEGFYMGEVTTAWNSAGYSKEFSGNPKFINHAIENINKLVFGGGIFGAGSRIIVYGIEK